MALVWTRAPGAERCISPEELVKRSRTRPSGAVLGVELPDADFVVVGRIERRAGGFRTELTLRDGEGHLLGERTLESPARSCRALDESLILAIELLVGTPGPGVLAPSDAEATQEPPSGREPETAPESPPSTVPEAHRRKPPPRRRALGERSPPAPPWAFDVGVGASAAGGFAPRPTLGPTIYALMRPPGWMSIGVRAAVYPFAVDRVTVPGEGIAVRGFVAGVDLCPIDLERRYIQAFACTGLHIGGLHAEPLGPRSNAGDLLVAVVPLRAEIRARTGRVAPYAAFTTRLSPTSPAFIYRAPSGAEQASFRVPWATIELELGVVWHIAPRD